MNFFLFTVLACFLSIENKLALMQSSLDENQRLKRDIEDSDLTLEHHLIQKRSNDQQVSEDNLLLRARPIFFEKSLTNV